MGSNTLKKTQFISKLHISANTACFFHVLKW